MSKVHLDTLKPWIAQRIMEMLGFEDDVVVEFVVNQLEDTRVMTFDNMRAYQSSFVTDVFYFYCSLEFVKVIRCATYLPLCLLSESVKFLPDNKL